MERGENISNDMQERKVCMAAELLKRFIGYLTELEPVLSDGTFCISGSVHTFLSPFGCLLPHVTINPLKCGKCD